MSPSPLRHGYVVREGGEEEGEGGGKEERGKEGGG